jgi:hypothetical protein
MDNNAAQFFVGFIMCIGFVVVLAELVVMCIASLFSRKERGMFKDQIEAGAKLLDEKLGQGWEDRLDLEKLDLGDDCNCIVGQLYGNFWKDAPRLFPEGSNVIKASISHGFNTDPVYDPDADDGILHALTLEWKAYIQERRSHVSTN